MLQKLFKIYDGRNYFWQYDTGQKLIVLDQTVNEVHFYHKNMSRTILRDVYTDADGLRVCSVPDVLLTLPKNLIASATVEDENPNRAFRSVKFAVMRRPLLNDYVTYDDNEFGNRLNVIENIIDDACLAKKFNSIAEAEQWALESKTPGAVISINIESEWQIYTVKDDYSIVPVCDQGAINKNIEELNQEIDKIKDNPDEELNSINELINWVQNNNVTSSITTVTLLANAWTGNGSTYSQVVTIKGVTTNSQIYLNPNAAQIVTLQDAEVSLVAENNNGIVTVWAIGDKLSEDMTIQVTITEVTSV